MRSVLIIIGIVVGCFVVVFLPQAFWPDWPVQPFLGAILLAGVVGTLVKGLRSGEFHTYHGVSQRRLNPIGFYANVVFLSIATLFIVAMLVTKIGEWLGQMER